MRRSHGDIPLAMVFLEGLIVGGGLLVAISTYSHFTAATALCGYASSGSSVLQLLMLLWLALPLAVGLPLYVAVTAVQDRRWAWLATVVLAVAASALIALAGADTPVRPVVAAVLGKLNGACGGFDAFIAYFVALAVVELTCVVYIVRPRRAQ